ncbi:MAG: acetate/propionate family kinase [Deltaproteobacteria bacterium]|nr:acetate/propionate family kinase [Deltaproteobacteria bacterium]
MRVLTVNAGSSSLKWSLIETPSLQVLAAGNESLPPGQEPDLAPVLARAGKVDAVAHRVVHGGTRFRQTAKIDREVRETLDALKQVDPLHAPPALQGIDAAMRAFPGVPELACFDTAFHATISEAAATYAIPHAWTEKWGLRRFGFHGLSVTHAVRRAPELVGRPLERMVVLHLGSGCSLTAVQGGKSVDTTMGFTPLEGLVMATRSGTIDPGLMLHVLREGDLTVDALDHGLERESGLLGVSGVSGDLREVLTAAASGNARAKLAYGVFIVSLRRMLGQMLSALDGLDALVFTGGIGEHSAPVRRDALAKLGWLEVKLDDAKNASAKPDVDISASEKGPRVLVIEAREDLTMAREVVAVLG